MANLSNVTVEGSAESPEIDSIVEGTLAYYQADEEQSETLKKVFKLLAHNIISSEGDVLKRRSYSRTLLGIKECKEIEAWLVNNIEALKALSSHEALLQMIWPVLASHIKNSTFIGCNPKDVLQQLSLGWIGGHSFDELLRGLEGARIGSRSLIPKIEHVVDICENALGFDGALILGAISQLLEFMDKEEHKLLLENINALQKRLKYGLPSPHAIVLLEIGFVDRPLAIQLSEYVKHIKPTRTSIIQKMKQMKTELEKFLDQYPAYFAMQLKKLME